MGICLNIPYDIYFKMLLVYIYIYIHNVEPAKQLSSFISLTRIPIYIYICNIMQYTYNIHII